jgi:hypothetical protein
VADDEGWEARMAARTPGAWSRIDIHTEEGQATRRDVLAFIAENLRFHRQAIATGTAAEYAADDYRESLDLLAGRMRADGLTAAEVDELIGKYRQVNRG